MVIEPFVPQLEHAYRIARTRVGGVTAPVIAPAGAIRTGPGDLDGPGRLDPPRQPTCWGRGPGRSAGHTAASLAIEGGANVKAVQQMLGHASAAMTIDVCAGLFEDDLDAVTLGAIIAGADPHWS